MRKKTSGLVDLVSTLLKQHGPERSIQIANGHVRSITDQRRLYVWRAVLARLKDMR